MDQLKKVGEFIWQYRFWFSLGLVLIFAGVTYPSGSQMLFIRAAQRKNQLDSAYDSVARFQNGREYPNQEWVKAATAKKSEVKGAVESAWERIYKEQEKLMTWPADVSAKFAGRPFGSELTDKENRNTFLVKYRRAFPDYVLDVYSQLKPIEKDEETDKIKGVVDADVDVIHRAVWTRTPVSLEAWLAQEELWVQAAIFRAIAKANEGAESWSKAPIHRLNAIVVGSGALDPKSKAANVQLVAYQGARPAAAPGAGSAAGSGGGSQGIDPVRYIEKTNEYRVMPVFVSLMADQMQIPRVLATLSAADFSFTISHVNLSVPQKFEVPKTLRDAGLSGDRGGKNDPIYNSFQVDLWGQARIYEMPPALKAEWDKKGAAPAGSAAPATKGAPPTISSED